MDDLRRNSLLSVGSICMGTDCDFYFLSVCRVDKQRPLVAIVSATDWKVLVYMFERPY